MVATVVALALLVPATVACLAHLIPTLVGLLPRRRRRRTAQPRHSIAILIPAHDEQATLPITLQSLAILDYPPELVQVYVVADNCTDDTAAIARASGAICFVRGDPGNRGKGHAVAFGLERVLQGSPDVVLVLDADCTLNETALCEFDHAFAAGAEVLQCAVRSRNADDGPSGYVAAVGSAVDEGRSRGLDRIGLSVPLRGTGMAFRRRVLERVRWAAFGVAEDAEYARQLRVAGVRIQHCGEAIASCHAPAGVADFCQQRRRWREAGLLSSKPLVLVHLALTVVVAMTIGFVWWPLVLSLFTAGIYLRAAWVVGLARNRAGLMLRSSGLVLRLGWVTLGGVLHRGRGTWERTPRTVGRQVT